MIKQKSSTKCRNKKQLNPEIITKRLTSELLSFSPQDFDFFQQLFSNSQLHEMLRTRDSKNDFWTSVEFFEYLITHGPHYIWFYNKKPIGLAGFYRKGNSNFADIQYMLLPEYWNLGFATEILNSLIEKAEELGLTKLYLEIHPENKNSIKVANKTGFEFSKWRTYKNSDPHLEYLYEIY